ncbi:MAG: DUF2225 domain-containing protein [Planctomycetes bacterium]|nr:DUF2225 domain-containing protein [Planctomycetota bacterium]
MTPAGAGAGPARPAEGGPFLRRTVPCPVCRKGAPNRSIKVKSYEFVEIEPDRYPRVVRWRDAAFQAVRPNHYHFWACVACGFVDEGESFRARSERAEAPAGVAELLRKPPPAVALLRGWLDLASPRYDFRTALGIHLLGLAVQDALGAHRDAVLRASLSLRAAWMFRELDGLGAALARPAALSSDLAALCSAWPEAPLDERACLRRAAESYRAQYDLTRGGADARRDVTLLLLLGEIRRRAGDTELAVGALRLASQTLLGPGTGGVSSGEPWRERALEEMRDLRERLRSQPVQSGPT